MITAFELVRLTLEGNLKNEEYKILTVQPQSSLCEVLIDEVCYNLDWEDVNVCVGAIPYHGDGVLGYLVKRVREIPTAHNILGIADAIYEVDMTEGESLYYTVWAIQKD